MTSSSEPGAVGSDSTGPGLTGSDLTGSDSTGTDSTGSDSKGEQNLDVLIQSMQPSLHPSTYVFVTVEPSFALSTVNPLMQFHEKEGITLILEKGKAIDAGLLCAFPCRMITLNIHSSLDAVGFLARITNELAALDMGVNPVSGYYHDHLFVPEDRAEDAIQALKKLSSNR